MAYNDDGIVPTQKSFLRRVYPVMAAGTGLFAEGYIQASISGVNTMLAALYGTAFTKSGARTNISAFAFLGIVVGQLAFGYTSDKYGRKNSLMVSTAIMFVFSALSAGAYGAKGSLQGMFVALTVYRVLVGVGIGGEYPSGSVSAAEATGELKAGTRNRWFIFATNQAIDWGFVIGSFVPWLLVIICTEKHLRAAWRISLGLGAVSPAILLIMRLRLKDPVVFLKNNSMKAHIPAGLVLKYYWFRLLIVGLIWFMYDFSTYAFGIYGTPILAIILGDSYPIQTSLAWGIVLNLFYCPGALLGAFVSDWIGPKYCLILGLLLQAVFGYAMAGAYNTLATPANIAGFTVMYGIFLSFGELGPGEHVLHRSGVSIGSCWNVWSLFTLILARHLSGRYYGIAAAIGKVGAFVGTYAFESLLELAHNGTESAQYPFWLASSMCIFSAILAFFFLPHIGQDTITREDEDFNAYLASHGFDVSQLGNGDLSEDDSIIAYDHTATGVGAKAEK